jgi:hypothetical protein
MNGIGVGAFGGSSGSGPTVDGRSQPDLVAPGSMSSYATPLVSGAAAILVQAGNQGLGGASPAAIEAAVDARTIKTLLLTGAMKPGGWTHSETAPLDTRYGAGVLNVYASYIVLTGGMRLASVPTTHTASLGGDHHAVNAGNLHGATGWNLKQIQNQLSGTTDAVDHYVLDLPNHHGMAFTATLTWYRPISQSVVMGAENYTLTGLHNLDLYLYDALTNTRIAASTSSVDNVEHLSLLMLPAGRYDLQVLKHGGGSESPEWVSLRETYAIAWRASLLGDANLDNMVNAFDLNVLAANWQGTGKFWMQGDFTGDGVVNAFDLNALAANWMNAVPGSFTAALEAAPFLPGGSSVPEPASLAVLAGGLVGALLRRRGLGHRRRTHRGPCRN